MLMIQEIYTKEETVDLDQNGTYLELSWNKYKSEADLKKQLNEFIEECLDSDMYGILYVFRKPHIKEFALSIQPASIAGVLLEEEEDENGYPEPNEFSITFNKQDKFDKPDSLRNKKLNLN